MCSGWKSVGVGSLYFSLIYNFLLLFVTVPFVLRCYDDCDGVQPGDYPEDCYETFAIYTIYLPTVFAAPFISLTDRNSVHYLQWWLLLHAVITCCSYLIFICYRPFYTDFATEMNIIGVAALIFAFGVVVYHFFRIRRSPVLNTDPNPAESSA